jgi:hypothetical protein
MTNLSKVNASRREYSGYIARQAMHPDNSSSQVITNPFLAYLSELIGIAYRINLLRGVFECLAQHLRH